MTVSRARGKLEAALELFDLTGAVRGASAVDVGASTGGFTQALLEHGATAVTAVDVGHDQLHPSLRSDARVTSLEGTDWRRLSLGVAEGPFDFFTVDVSFVAARNMLRGLAFRLRPGAQGVVLIKPQFELDDRQVAAKGVDDAGLRRAAVDKVRHRAEALGFALIAQADSPVAGASGTVEILAHLRFAGRPDALPKPGERRRENAPAPSPSRRTQPGTETLRWFAVVAPGLEEVARAEVERLPGVTDVSATPGGVEWNGPPASGYRANLWLRIATRVLARVGEVEAREFGKLRRRAAHLPWRNFVPAGARIAVQASASRCRLYHTEALAENAALAIADAVPSVRLLDKEAEPDTAPELTILLRGVGDVFTFSVDASGERLHRRGARLETGRAPLRETLAAGLLALAGWTPETALVDPMCGAGTIVLEACTQAMNRAPGLDRAFAPESGQGFAINRWPLFAEGTPAAAAASALREEARTRALPHPPAPIQGSDRDPKAIESTRNNATRAGVATELTLVCQDVADVRPPAATGLVVVNPPYGRRIGDPRAAARAYRDLGRVLRLHFRGWRAAIIVPANLEPTRALGLPVTERFQLRNGGLPVTLALCALA